MRRTLDLIANYTQFLSEHHGKVYGNKTENLPPANATLVYRGGVSGTTRGHPCAPLHTVNLTKQAIVHLFCCSHHCFYCELPVPMRFWRINQNLVFRAGHPPVTRFPESRFRQRLRERPVWKRARENGENRAYPFTRSAHTANTVRCSLPPFFCTLSGSYSAPVLSLAKTERKQQKHSRTQ